MTQIKGVLTQDNAGTIYHVPNPTIINARIPDLYLPDDIQKYNIGTGLIKGNKAYFYAYCKTTIGPNMFAKVYNTQDIANSAIAVAASKGATQIAVTASSSSGLAHGGVFALNYLKGGQVVVFPAAGAAYTFTSTIVGSSVLAATGTIYLDLEEPIPCDITTGATAEATASPWKNIVPMGSTYSPSTLSGGLFSACGVAKCLLTSGQWGWLQTYGPTWVSPAASLGAGENSKGAWIQADGSLTDQDYALANLGMYAGWVMANDVAGGQGAPFVWLTIARP